MEPTGGLPPVASIGFGAPFRWLGGAWRDLFRAPGPCLAYGLGLTLASVALCYALYASGGALWSLALSLGFVFVAPMMAMGLYEAGRALEAGETPTLPAMILVRSAIRQDTAYLGLALVLVYLLWGRIAQIVYGLSTYQIHRTLKAFLDFALGTPEGQTMLVTGTVIGGAIAFFTFSLVVISAPMLLDHRSNVFVATVTSVRAVTTNFGPMLLWAALIVTLLLVCAATGLAGLIVIFPWLGLASWRAYRELAPGAVSPASA